MMSFFLTFLKQTSTVRCSFSNNIYLFNRRWLKCIFNREFHPTDVLILWDSILANDFEETKENPNYKSNLIMLDYICIAMMSYVREECNILNIKFIYLNLVLKKDQNECFQRCFKYPLIETTVILVKLARGIKCKRLIQILTTFNFSQSLTNLLHFSFLN